MHPEIYFYVWPHEKPQGTREIIYSARPHAKDLAEALAALDTAYDLIRHLYVARLCKEDGNAVFCVNADALPNGSASFQVAVTGHRSYSRIVTDLNASWLRDRARLAEALLV